MLKMFSMKEIWEFRKMAPLSYTCPNCGKVHDFPYYEDYRYFQKDSYGNYMLWDSDEGFYTICKEDLSYSMWWRFHTVVEDLMFPEIWITTTCDKNYQNNVASHSFRENKIMFYEVKLKGKWSQCFFQQPIVVEFGIPKRRGYNVLLLSGEAQKLKAKAKHPDASDELLRKIVLKTFEIRKADENSGSTETEDVLLLVINHPNVSVETAEMIVNSELLTDLERIIMDKASNETLKKVVGEGYGISLRNMNLILNNPKTSERVRRQCFKIFEEGLNVFLEEYKYKELFYLSENIFYGHNWASLFKKFGAYKLVMILLRWLDWLISAKDDEFMNTHDNYRKRCGFVLGKIARLVKLGSFSSDELLEIIDGLSSRDVFDYIFWFNITLNPNCTADVLARLIDVASQAFKKWNGQLKLGTMHHYDKNEWTKMLWVAPFIKAIREHPRANRGTVKILLKKIRSVIAKKEYQLNVLPVEYSGRVSAYDGIDLSGLCAEMVTEQVVNLLEDFRLREGEVEEIAGNKDLLGVIANML